MGNEKTFAGGRIDAAGLAGPVWLIGLLFTIGYAHLSGIKILWAVLLWPYYLGGAVSH